MKKGLFFVLGLIFITAGFASAQTARKTVTNADLEKFRVKRLAAEKDYRENYARRGFPSPEELEERHEQERRDLSIRSARLERENYVREQQRLEEQYYQEQSQAYYNYNTQAAYNNYGADSAYGYAGYGYSNGYYGNRIFRGSRRFGTLAPGTPFSSLGGVRINTNGVRISTGTGFRGGFVNNGGGIRGGGVRSGGGGVRISVGGGTGPR